MNEYKDNGIPYMLKYYPRVHFPYTCLQLPPDFQISLRFSLSTPVFQLQVILRQVHQMTPKWHWTLIDQRYQYKTLVHWHSGLGQISKLSYLGMELGHWQKFQKLPILFLFHVVKMRLNLRSTGSGFWDTGWFSKLPYLGMKLSRSQNFHKLHIYSLSTPGGSKLSLFSLHGQQFPR